MNSESILKRIAETKAMHLNNLPKITWNEISPSRGKKKKFPLKIEKKIKFFFFFWGKEKKKKVKRSCTRLIHKRKNDSYYLHNLFPLDFFCCTNGEEVKNSKVMLLSR